MATRTTPSRATVARPVTGSGAPRHGPKAPPTAPVDAGRVQAGATVLEALHVRLAADLIGLTTIGEDRNEYGGDFEGLVTAAQTATQVETDQLLRYRVERRLAEIEAVQSRVRAGVYGMCDACGSPIPEERLEAVPEATHCLGCQRVHERSHGRRGSVRRAA